MLGADRGYDTRDFVWRARALGVTPHVAQNDRERRSAIDRAPPQARGLPTQPAPAHGQTPAKPEPRPVKAPKTAVLRPSWRAARVQLSPTSSTSH